MQHSIQWLLPLSMVLLLSLFGSILSRKVNKLDIIFFILIGIFVANLFNVTFFSKEFLEPLAQLGLVLLLFTIGLELPLKKIKRLGKYLLTGSFLQIFLSTLVITILIFVFTRNAGLSVLLALPLSMSSTAVLGKLLQERGEEASLNGELTLGILIVQDIVSVLIIAFFTFFAANNAMINWELIILILRNVLIVGLVFFVLSYILNFVFEKIKLNRLELSLFIFALLFFLLYLFALIEIPETTAGFLIGLILAQRIEQYEIFAQIRIFRDILLVLFFFFLGTFITGLTIITVFKAFAISVFLMLVKFIVTWLIFLNAGLHRKTSFRIGFNLMQLGEFSFIILSILATGNLINNNIYQLFLLVVIWSLLMFTGIYQFKEKIYLFFSRHFGRYISYFEKKSKGLLPNNLDQLPYENHIVLCGYGRVGSYVGHGLILSRLPIVVIDTNVIYIKKLLSKGVKAIYGDATERDILDYAQVDKAQFIVVAVPDQNEQERIIMTAKKLNPNICVISRANLVVNYFSLKNMGVKLVFQPEFEAALSILKRILKLYNLEKDEIKKRIQYLKMKHGLQS
jgi:CPA2 family monovalent cation:H+ antiporter-2